MYALPQEFQTRMHDLLGEEVSSFLACMEQPPFRGIRWNPLKCGEEVLRTKLPFAIQPSPFSPLSYYIPPETEKIGLLPLHHAGAFYVQEPSAASAVTVLDPQSGDRVLDLCAAPGGKSTQIASLLQGEGLLWSNEFVKKRALILLSNLERMGVRNGVISSCRPDVLCNKLSGFFDKVLVDAPCSGEGIFHRDEQAVADWSVEHVQACAVRQLAILDSAAQSLRPGGVLVYSTCTFSPEENEQAVIQFLKTHPDYMLEDCGVSFGRPSQVLPETRRIFPMDGGDGHFVAKLRKLGENPFVSVPEYVSIKKEGAEEKAARTLYESIFQGSCSQRMLKQKDAFFLLPDTVPPLDGLGVLRAGVRFGECRANRIEPAHHLFSAARAEELQRVLDFSSDSMEIRRFLVGEELEVEDDFSGYTGVAVDGVMLGFGKCSGGRLKNRYPKGLRNYAI